MPVLLYARVSTYQQAERELSIPAQVRLMKRYASEHNLLIAGTSQDIASGRSLKDRPGLLSLIHQAQRDRNIDGILVHRIDRLSRNVFNYLILKGKLRNAGVRIYSVIETLEANPMGEFLEHIMAAQAEFYSANLSLEVKKGIEERLLRGKWSFTPPLGYLNQAGQVVVDPARGQFMQRAFELWAGGKMSSMELADEIHTQGLVGKSGKQVRASMFCRLLQNPFYTGQMVVKGKTFPGTHPPLVSQALFDRAQEVFRQKHSGGKRQFKHLDFLLSGLVRCPGCGSTLIGEQHQKKSDKVYRYYRCHERGCGFNIRAEVLEQRVCSDIVKLELVRRCAPKLRRIVRLARKLDSKPRAHLYSAISPASEDTALLKVLEALEITFLGNDTVTKKQTLRLLVSEVLVIGEEVKLKLTRAMRGLMDVAPMEYSQTSQVQIPTSPTS